MPAGGTYQLAGVLCPARTDSSSPTTISGFISSHLEHLFWQITPGLLQGKVQDPGGDTGPKRGSGPCRRCIKAIRGLLLGNHRKGDPGPLSVGRLAHLSSGDRAQTQVWSSNLHSQMAFRWRP